MVGGGSWLLTCCWVVVLDDGCFECILSAGGAGWSEGFMVHAVHKRLTNRVIRPMYTPMFL